MRKQIITFVIIILSIIFSNQTFACWAMLNTELFATLLVKNSKLLACLDYVEIKYSNYDWSTITWNVIIDKNSKDKINKDIIVDWWDLKIDANLDIWKYKIILKKAGYLKIWANVHINSIEWTVSELEIKSDTEINSMSVKVSWETKIVANVWIKKINLKTDDLILSTDNKIWDWIIYVYDYFNWWINDNFKWKISVFRNYSLNINSKLEWKYCSLWKIWPQENTDIKTYNYKWLFWNIYPILNYTIDDNSKDYNSAKEISQWFDTRFSTVMKEIDGYNSQINNLVNIIKLSNENEKIAIQNEINSIKASKEEYKKSFIEDIDSTFDTLTPIIDEGKEYKELFQDIKIKYKSAIKFEYNWLINQACNNSELNWKADSVYVRWWKIIYWNTNFIRESYIQADKINEIEKMLDKMSDEKISKITKRVDELLIIYAKKWNYRKNFQNMNRLMDLKNILKDKMLHN